MKTKKTGPGRPEKAEKTISVHCRVSPILYQLLVDKAKKEELLINGKPNISRVLMNEALKNLIK